MTTRTTDGHGDHPNAGVLREFFAAFGEADTERMGRVVADGFVWHVPGTSPIAGEWRGVQGVMEGIRAIGMSLGDGNSGFELLEVAGNDRAAFSVHRDFYDGPGNRFDLRYAVYARMEEGRIAEAWELPFDPHESDRYVGSQAATIVLRKLAAS